MTEARFLRTMIYFGISYAMIDLFVEKLTATDLTHVHPAGEPDEFEKVAQLLHLVLNVPLIAEKDGRQRILRLSFSRDHLDEIVASDLLHRRQKHVDGQRRIATAYDPVGDELQAWTSTERELIDHRLLVAELLSENDPRAVLARGFRHCEIDLRGGEKFCCRTNPIGQSRVFEEVIHRFWIVENVDDRSSASGGQLGKPVSVLVGRHTTKGAFDDLNENRLDEERSGERVTYGIGQAMIEIEKVQAGIVRTVGRLVKVADFPARTHDHALKCQTTYPCCLDVIQKRFQKLAYLRRRMMIMTLACRSSRKCYFGDEASVSEQGIRFLSSGGIARAARRAIAGHRWSETNDLNLHSSVFHGQGG